jgi:outer membrane receptor protein involved in Fe transport
MHFEKLNLARERELVAKRLLLTCAIGAILSVEMPALAQEPEASGSEEVLVTARKRPESVQNTPVAVTVIGAEQLDRNAIRTIEEIAASTPQLNVVRGSSGSGATLSLRGVGSSYTSIGIEQSVAVNVDGVYYGQGRIINEGFFDMERVEILKGPQALFFGKNATAGVLSFTSASPSDEFEALGRIGYEFTADTVVAEGVVSGPINDEIGVRLAVRSSTMFGGYVENEAPATNYLTLDVANGFAASFHPSAEPEQDLPQEKDLVARLTLDYKPSEDFKVTLKGSVDRYRVDNATWGNEMYDCPLGHSQVNPTQSCDGNWKIQQNDVPADIAATNPLLGRHNGKLYQDYDSYAVAGIVDYSTELVDINWVTGFHHFENYFLGDYDFSGAINGGTWGAEKSEYQAFSSELRAQTSLEGPVNFMVGLYYQSTELNFHQLVLFPGGLENSSPLIDPALRHVTLEKRSLTDGATAAGFAQILWDITPTLELAVGARYTHETKDSFFVQPYVIGPYQGVFVEGEFLRANQSFNNLSPEATLTWKANEDLTVYAAYKQGFKSGGFSGSALYSVNTTVNDLAFDPETVEGFEGGIRARFMDRQLRVRVDAYAYEYSDLQIDFFDTAKIQYITTNAASSKTKGIELQAEWTPEAVPGLSFGGTLAYNDAYYVEFPEAPCYTGQTPAAGCNIILVDTNGDGVGDNLRPVQDLGGKPTQLAPKWTASFAVTYESKPFSGMVFGATANVRYSGKYFGMAFIDPRTVQDSYAVFDATMKLGDADGKWDISLIGKNLTDEYYLTSIGGAPSSGGGTGTPGGVLADLVGNPGLPRTIALQFALRY